MFATILEHGEWSRLRDYHSNIVKDGMYIHRTSGHFSMSHSPPYSGCIFACASTAGVSKISSTASKPWMYCVSGHQFSFHD